MDTLKLHDLELSSIFWELRFLMTEKDIVNLLRIVTSWFDLTKTDIGRKALKKLEEAAKKLKEEKEQAETARIALQSHK